ncbi:hypothetical protein [Candidatus Nitrosocosmicus sp. SS]|uniref:hypothetical protein n=1 Tax=Candidatus Nitrosocosmicus agrestis TaxID=2563600 RepID=UPI0013319EA3|nr:hypothetical protein [Candidatus Nitrosocosmicus sp. SS]
MLKVGSEFVWLWVATETRKQANSRTSFANKSKDTNMFVAERFISGLVKIHGKHPVFN